MRLLRDSPGRGRVRSRSQESVLAELRTLADAGYREVVLAGINLSSYGKDTGSTLARLTAACGQVEGIDRIRLGSLEPDLMTDSEIEILAGVDSLCPQFHLSLQSGCDATLRRMRRIYDTAQYVAVADKLRAAFGGNVSFTTDVIVGFPGETEEEFRQSLAFVESFGFLKVHVFPYSARPGTPAADFPDQIPEAERLPGCTGCRKPRTRPGPGWRRRWRTAGRKCCWKSRFRPPCSPAIPGCTCRWW